MASNALEAALAGFHGLSQEQMLAHLEKLAPVAAQALDAQIGEAVGQKKWLPSAGPQREAYRSKADILLYGGSAGGGKTSILIGLALTKHRRSLIMRRQYTELSAITDEAIRLNETRTGFNGSSPPSLRTSDGRLIEFGAASKLGDERSWQGRDHDLIGFDEAVHFAESQVRFLMGWLRTTDPAQRCRVVLASNPPVGSQGDWIIKMFGPWLDPTHPRPAEPSELRWYVTDDDGADIEVETAEPVDIDGKSLIPRSRTFIPARLSDNPFLAKSGYQAQLDALPPEIRAALRDGNFMAARRDQARQVIPTEWVIEAQRRWTPRPPANVAMTAMAIDPAQGGEDCTALAMRHGGWYAPLVVAKGIDTPDGSSVAALVVRHRRDRCPVVIDAGGGYGGGPTERLKDNGVLAVPFNGASASVGRARDGSARMFLNRRAEAWWRFREALDPDQQGGSAIALPDDPELRADLTAPTYKPDILKIQVEAKEDIRKRLGRSTDRGDAVVMCLSQGDAAARKLQAGAKSGDDDDPQWAGYGDHNARPTRANIAYAHLKPIRR